MPTTTRTWSRGWHVAIDHPDGNTITVTERDIVDDVEWVPRLNGLPKVRIPVARSDRWRSDKLDRQPMRVWKDGHRLLVDELETVETDASNCVLVGRGGLGLADRAQKEVDEKEAHLVAEEIIQNQTPLKADVDAPNSSTSSDTRMQSADTTSEWEDRLPSAHTDADVVEVRNGSLLTHPTAFFQEAEDADTILIGTENLESSSDRWSGGSVIQVDDPESNGTWAKVAETFTLEHTYPSGDYEIAFRTQQPNTGNHGFNLLIDGTVVEDIPKDVLADNESEPDWFTVSSSTADIGDLAPGDHTVAIEFDEYSDNDGTVNIDCLTIYQASYPPNLTENVTDNVLEGPDLHPDGVEQEMADAESFLSVVAGKLESAWDDVSGDQAVAISNDQGANWIEATNSETVEGDFADGSAQIRARFRLSGYDNDPNVSPAGRKVSQKVDLYDLYADLDDTPLLIDKMYDGQAVNVLQEIADFGDFIFSVELDDVGDPVVRWTQPGQRTRDSPSTLVNFDTARTHEDSYDRVVVKGQARSIEREIFNASHGNAVGLDEANLLESTGRVYDPSDETVVFEEGTDYELNRAKGRITTLSGGSMTDGKDYAIDYEFTVSGSYEASDAPSTPKTLVEEIPSISTSRGCEQAALYLYREVDEPLVEAQATIDDVPVEESLVETIGIEGLPTDERVKVNEVTQSSGKTTLRLGSRASINEAVEDIRSQLRSVSRLV